MNQIYQTYETARTDDCSDKLFEKLDSIFSGNETVIIDKDEIIRYLIQMSDEFKRFAQLQRCFYIFQFMICIIWVIFCPRFKLFLNVQILTIFLRKYKCKNILKLLIN